MSKISLPPNNDFCPQTLFLYGAYNEDGTPNFGLFCWATYCWDEDCGFIAAIGEPKLTQELIRKNGVFSANLVTESLLPLADWMGNHAGEKGEKQNLNIQVEKGRVLDVPILTASPVSFELEVFHTVDLKDDSVVFLCKIRNVLQDEALADDGRSLEERIRSIAPVHTTCATYFGWDGKPIAGWGEPQEQWKAD